MRWNELPLPELFSKVNPATRTVFLLSPANLNGIRAKQFSSPRATFATAVAFRSPEGVPIADAFAFMSALYFRGKIAYARRFANPPDGAGGIHVIAPGFGLVAPEWHLDQARFRKLKRTEVDCRVTSYRRPLEKASRELSAQLCDDTRVVLLGSIATGKYVDILGPIFGDRLVFPRSFVGIGDMSRGSLMLKAAASGEEMEYAGMEDRRRNGKI